MSKGCKLAAAAGLVIIGIPAAIMTFGSGGSPPAPKPFTAAAPVSGTLDTTGIPKKLVPWIKKASKTCDAVSAPLIAAQEDQESGFVQDAVSSTGAEGYSQFEPDTWAKAGVDANHDGKKSPYQAADAVISQAKYDCQLAKKVKHVGGSTTKLMLAAYNAGAASVTAAGGIPPIRQTQNYVSAIDVKIKRYTAKPAGSSQIKIPARSGPVIKKVIKVLKSKLGTPYSFGGGTVSKPTVGRTSPAGWDCSSYMMMGWYQATGGKIKLERTTEQQVHSNLLKRVSKNNLRVGDMIYIKTEGGSYSHVVMYLGHHKIIEEPHTGAAARINPVSEYNGKTQAVRRMKTSQTNQDA